MVGSCNHPLACTIPVLPLSRAQATLTGDCGRRRPTLLRRLPSRTRSWSGEGLVRRHTKQAQPRTGVARCHVRVVLSLRVAVARKVPSRCFDWCLPSNTCHPRAHRLASLVLARASRPPGRAQHPQAQPGPARGGHTLSPGA